MVAVAFFSSTVPSSCSSCHFSQPPIPPARQRMRCAVHADRQSLAAGKADRSPPACLSPLPPHLGTGSRAPADASLAPRCGPSNRLIGPAPAIISAVPTTFILPTTTLPFRSSHPAAATAAYCCCCAAAGLKLRHCSPVFPSDETPDRPHSTIPTPLPLRQLKSAPCHFAGPLAARGSSLNCLSGTRNQPDGPFHPLPPRPA